MNTDKRSVYFGHDAVQTVVLLCYDTETVKVLGLEPREIL